MALGIVSNEEFERELAKVEREIKFIDDRRGRGHAREVPSSIRNIIAEESINGAPAKEIARAFGLSESSISAYKNDATSTASYNEPDQELRDSNNEVRKRIIGTAKQRLIDALESLTPEKMENAKARDISAVARDMSAVVKDMEPQTHNDTQVKFTFHVPVPKQAKDFEVIDVVS